MLASSSTTSIFSFVLSNSIHAPFGQTNGHIKVCNLTALTDMFAVSLGRNDYLQFNKAYLRQ